MLPRDLGSRSEVPRDRTKGLVRIQPSLFALGRFRAAPSGLRSVSSATDLNPPRLLSSGCRSPRSFTSTCQPHPHAHASAPLLRSFPLQRSTIPGVRMTRRCPTAGTVRPQRFSRSRRLAPPETMQGLFHPRCALGVLPDLGSSRGPFDPAGLHAPGSPLHGLRLARDEHVFACSPVLRFTAGSAAPFRGTRESNSGRCTVSITGESVFPQGATQGHRPS